VWFADATVAARIDAILGAASLASGVSHEQAPEDVGGRAALVEALNVPTNLKRGFAFGFLFAAAVFVFFVVIPGTYRSPALYVALWFVLAMGMGGLATTVLLIVSAYRLTKE